MKTSGLISHKLLVLLAAVSLSVMSTSLVFADAESNRKERNYIKEGNKLYNDGRYRAAMVQYQDALKENPSSVVGKYNLGLSQIRLGTNENDTTQAAKDMLKRGVDAMEQVAKSGSQNPGLASKANFNLGNVAFKSEDWASAISSYKQALRLNPEDMAAKRNLRIAQLKQQEQNQDQDKDKQDQNQDQQQDQDKDSQQNQNNQQDQQQQNQDKQQNQQQDLNNQTADQILKAMENKENQTRARVGTGNQGDKSTARGRNRKNW